MSRLSILSCALLAALPAAARAEQFVYRYQPGQTVQTRDSVAGAMMASAGGGATSLAKMRFRSIEKQVIKVLSVSGGVVTLEVTTLPISASITNNGQTQTEKPPSTKSILKVTDRGHFISKKASGGESGNRGSMPGSEVFDGLNFPARDLKPGDTWDDTITTGEGKTAQQVHVTWKYVGRAVIRGRDCAKITTTASIPLNSGEGGAFPGGGPPGEGKITATLTTYFDPKAGLEVYASGSVLMTARADLTQVSPEAGELVSVMKVNVVQSLQSSAAKK